MEKYSVWTNPDDKELPDGGLSLHFTLDELLTNVMIYWVTGTIGSSIRLYKERFRSEALAQMEKYVYVLCCMRVHYK